MSGRRAAAAGGSKRRHYENIKAVGVVSQFERYLDLECGRRVRRESHLNKQSREGVTLSELQ